MMKRSVRVTLTESFRLVIGSLRYMVIRLSICDSEPACHTRTSCSASIRLKSASTPNLPPLNPLTHGEINAPKLTEEYVQAVQRDNPDTHPVYLRRVRASSRAGGRQDRARQIRRGARPELQVRVGRQDAGRGVHDFHPEDDFADVAFDLRDRSQRLVALDDHGQAG